MNIAALKFLGLHYSPVAIEISESRCCHGNQINNTALSIWQLRQLLWLIWNEFRIYDNVYKIGTCSPKYL